MTAKTIDELVGELTPVRRVSPAQAWATVLGLTALVVAAVAALFGLRGDVLAGHPAGLVLLRSGTLLLLGSAALAALIAAARPGVGQASHGWRWALGAALLFPLATLVLTLAERSLPVAELQAASGPWCLGIGGVSGFAIGTALTAWLRMGAPVSLARAGWLTGLAAGAFGTFAYSLHCPSETLQYAGIWYTAAVGLCALGGRIAVPPLLRW
jgi:hypothetical protein